MIALAYFIILYLENEYFILGKRVFPYLEKEYFILGKSSTSILGK